MSNRALAEKKFKRLMGDQSKLLPKKKTFHNKTIVYIPHPIAKKDMNDYAYGKDINERVVKMAVGLAERMAVTMIRETLGFNVDAIVNSITASLTEKMAAMMPSQTTIIREVADGEVSDLKADARKLVFDTPDLNIDRSKGLELKGKIGETIKSDETTDEALEVLDNLS